MRRLILLVPTAGTAVLRVSQLATLFALSTLTSASQQSFLVTGFGLMASFTIITDSGAANYLLSLRPALHSRRVYRTVLLLQSTLAFIGLLALLIFLQMIAPADTESPSYFLLIALALSQMIDGLLRVAKAPWLVWRQDGYYGVPDVVAGIGKLVVVGIAVLIDQIEILLVMPAISLSACLAVIILVWPRLGDQRIRPDRLIRSVLEVGLTGSLSALYSQTPMFVAAAVLPIQDAAVMAVLYRVTQALELVPASVSAQFIPRIERDQGPVRLWKLFMMGGAVTATALTLAWPFVAQLLSVTIPWGLAMAVTIGFALKCGNYAFVAYLLAMGLIRERLIITVTTGAIAIAIVIPATLLFGTVGLAVASPLIELVFLSITLLVVGARAKRKGRLT